MALWCISLALAAVLDDAKAGPAGISWAKGLKKVLGNKKLRVESLNLARSTAATPSAAGTWPELAAWQKEHKLPAGSKVLLPAAPPSAAWAGKAETAGWTTPELAALQRSLPAGSQVRTPYYKPGVWAQGRAGGNPFGEHNAAGAAVPMLAAFAMLSTMAGDDAAAAEVEVEEHLVQGLAVALALSSVPGSEVSADEEERVAAGVKALLDKDADPASELRAAVGRALLPDAALHHGLEPGQLAAEQQAAAAARAGALLALCDAVAAYEQPFSDGAQVYANLGAHVPKYVPLKCATPPPAPPSMEESLSRVANGVARLAVEKVAEMHPGVQVKSDGTTRYDSGLPRARK